MSDNTPDARSGLIVGGRGGQDDHLLEDGQEEVFAREEVELGRIEHHTDAGGGKALENEKDSVGATGDA